MIAPYPDRIDRVTALGIARHFAVSAQVRWRSLPAWQARVDRGEIARQSYLDMITAFTGELGLVLLLTELHLEGVQRANDAARHLWNIWENGEAVGPWLFNWLTEHGIDPEEVNQLADAIVKAAGAPCGNEASTE